MSANKDFKPIVAELKNQGWIVDRTGQGHWRATPPDRTKSLVHFSMSDDYHALKNTLKDLTKNGFIWPPPSKKEQAVERKATKTTASPDDMIAELEAQLQASPPQSVPSPSSFSPQTNGASHHPRAAATKEDSMDRLFHELKEAKTYLVLTDEHMAACKRKLEEAQQAFAEAEAERNKASETLKAKKAEFDGAFETAAA